MVDAQTALQAVVMESEIIVVAGICTEISTGICREWMDIDHMLVVRFSKGNWRGTSWKIIYRPK